MINPFEIDGVWLKANLHTHTTNSDGEQSPRKRIAEYSDAGYDVLAITDHGVVTAAPERNDILLVQSIEMHPACADGDSYHLVGLDVSTDFPYDPKANANDLIAMVRDGGGEVIFAHPYWCGHTPAQIMALEGLAAVEVYNATCTKIGKGDSSVIWDYLLDAGCILPAVAVDDTHRGRDIFMGWTMLRARNRSVNAVLEAVRTGGGYSSTGPEIVDFRVVDGVVSIQCSPVAEIHFKCRRSRGHSFYCDNGDSLTCAEFPFPTGSGYVRVEIVDAWGRRAWTNPIVAPSTES